MIYPARLAPLAAVCLLATGCATTVPPLTSEFPTPLIENLPLTVGVFYDEDLQNFTYNERVSDGTNWTIELGESNVRLFNRLFRAMFHQVVPIDDIDNAPPAVDAVLRPVLEEYAFLTPNELGSRFYAVSIRYRLFLYDNSGEELADWSINAYGQSRSGIINAGKMKTGPLQEATNLAMRDAAAGTIMTLPAQDQFIALLDPDTADPDGTDTAGTENGDNPITDADIEANESE